ncbi:sigma factor-like helix-turn-helix DNA-binding protein [Desulfosporosinus sp. PR]|uniref:sigma factor-like helix-turn-helix DNA-binding protein n=1 Tax=Candidatus Desulfosporosinus nitrosoreducens TaxID=3401928 RepID=UPI0027FB0416|nr:sigma factor-like helix-turn-helix DNA-binding protein [Desulfosporosinus sp. PR]MDQ7095961.1 sigma factor-like helix-turn-helix DNA-binding protein [Desulfosporosinus sp. PR]
MEQLIKEYKIALRRVNKARSEATNEEDKSLLSSCADSLGFSIKYMELGKHPDNRRAITRRSSIQREIPMNPKNLDFIRALAMQNQPSEISDKMKKAIDDLGIVLRVMTTKEQEAYSLVRANGYSFSDAATIMHIQKATVQTLVKRAEDKIYLLIEDLTDHGITFKQDIQLEMF